MALVGAPDNLAGQLPVPSFYLLERREGGVRKPPETVVTFGAVYNHLFTCTLVQHLATDLHRRRWLK